MIFDIFQNVPGVLVTGLHYGGERGEKSRLQGKRYANNTWRFSRRQNFQDCVNSGSMVFDIRSGMAGLVIPTIQRISYFAADPRFGLSERLNPTSREALSNAVVQRPGILSENVRI